MPPDLPAWASKSPLVQEVKADSRIPWIPNEKQNYEARAFIELTSSVEKSVEDGIFNFKLVDILKLYEKRLQELGIRKEVNKSWFKEKILQYFPQDQEQSDGKHIVLIFPEGMQQMLKEAMNCGHAGEWRCCHSSKSCKNSLQQNLSENWVSLWCVISGLLSRAICSVDTKMLVAMLLNIDQM